MPQEESFTRIIREAGKLKLPYLLVGGHAVLLYGVIRLTRDMDLLIPDTRIDAWTYLLTKNLGYRLFQSSHAFLRFEHDSQDYIPIDFMVVNGSTWEKLIARTETRLLDHNLQIRLPHPTHLIAMKLTALSAPHRRKDNSDWFDIINIIREQKLSLEDAEFRSLILHYGGDEILQKLREALS